MKAKFFLATLLLAMLPFVHAKGQAIYDIQTVVDLDSLGNATIYQQWDVEVVSGTEWYIPISNLGDMYVHDLSVVELRPGTKEVIAHFEDDGRHWNSNRSKEEKTFRCGIVDKGREGVELCWGQGAYGEHTWFISYYVDGLVQSYDDADGFIYQFVNDDLIARPQHISLIIENETEDGNSVPFTQEDTQFWAFGYSGTNGLDDGLIWFESDKPFESRSWSVIAMCRFEKGRFTPVYNHGGSFDDVVERAMEGASFADDEQEDGSWKFFLAIIAAIVGYVVWKKIVVKKGYKYNSKLLGDKKVDGWFRDVPLDGNLPASLWVMNNGGRFEKDQYTKNIIGTYFLKWVFDGKLRPQATEVGKESKDLAIVGEIENPTPAEAKLWSYVVQSSGDDKILQAKEFDRWAKKHTTIFQSWLTTISVEGKNYLTEKGYVSGAKGTAAGIPAMQQLVQLNNFLNDYTLISERSVQEVGLWKSYLIFAQLFGIADKVTKELQKLYPNIYEEVSKEIGGNLASTVLWSSSLSNKAYTSGSYVPSTGSSRGGHGGFSSIGGGGGFSGGGHGGGSR